MHPHALSTPRLRVVVRNADEVREVARLEGQARLAVAAGARCYQSREVADNPRQVAHVLSR
eukprot:5710887-Alexandrium_andersonii.AAC.1